MSYKEEFAANNTDLQAILDTVNELPIAGASLETYTVTLQPSTGTDGYFFGVAYVGVSDNKLQVFSLENVRTTTTIDVVANTVLSCYPLGGGVLSDDFSNECVGGYGYKIDRDGTLYIVVPCFARNTLITLADGTTKAVQDVTYADNLLVWDFDKGCYASAHPLWIKKPQIADYYYRCKFADGTILKLIGSGGKCHRIMSIDDGCFLSATDCVGKRVMTQNGITTLLSCDRVNDPVEFYNIITNRHINLFAETVLTSCRLNNIYPIENMKFVKENRETVPMEAYDNVGADFYEGLRLAEHKVEDVAELNEYIKRLYALMETEAQTSVL